MHARSIARMVGRSETTINHLLGASGLYCLKALEPPALRVRYEHSALDKMLHIDPKKLDRVVQRIHRKENRHD